MLEITNLHATVAGKPILKGLSLAVAATLTSVIPAKAGTQSSSKEARRSVHALPRASLKAGWVPAFAGMTVTGAGMTILLSGYGGL